MGTMANSEDPDEMPHKAAFHQGLHCSLRENQSSENFFLIKTYNPGPLNIYNGHNCINFYGKFHW